MNNSKINTNTFAWNTVSDELRKRGFSFIKNGWSFIVNEKKINIRGCNTDNGMAQKTGPGWNRLDPERFDYFICVSFDNNLNNIRYFIFSKKEVEEFPFVVWKNTPKLKNIMYKQNDDKLDKIVKESENKWNKLVVVDRL